MPLANRVDPFGEIHAVAARGLLMGNRGGRLHDPGTHALGRRRWASRRWICCRLDFRGRRRQVMGWGYTELFFLDEVTALAAGHRPCFECRRQQARAFAAALRVGLGLSEMPSADAIDSMLHAERLVGPAKRRHAAPSHRLPDGAMIEIDGAAHAVRGGKLLKWSFTGYRQASRQLPDFPALLSPPAIIAALASGYRPVWHPSAD